MKGRQLTLPAIAAMVCVPLSAQDVQPIKASYAMTAAASAEAEIGDARFVQLWTSDPEVFTARWTGEGADERTLAKAARRGEMLQMFIAIDGCRRDRRGTCFLQGNFQLRRPDGSPDGEPISFTAWQGKAPAEGRLALSSANIGAFIAEGDPAGEYTATLTITDVVARRSGTSTVVLTFTD